MCSAARRESAPWARSTARTRLRRALWQPGSVKLHTHCSHERQQEPDDGDELLVAPTQLQDLRLEPDLVKVEYITGDHWLVLALQPPDGRRTRHAELGHDIGLAGRSDEIPQAVVVCLLAAFSRCSHCPMMARTATPRNPWPPA